MDAKELAILLEKNENEHVEFKKAEFTFNFDKLTEYCAALANERGGLLIFGVTDKKPREIVGTQAFKENLTKIKERLIAKVYLRIDVEEIRTPEGRVLVFHIPSRPIGMPIHINGRYLMRAGQALTAMPPDMLKRIFDEADPDFSAEICQNASFEDLNPEAIEDFRKRWVKKSGNGAIAGLSREQLLTDAELIIEGKLTYAALILFGKQETMGRYLGQAEVIFEYRGNEASGPAQQRIEFRQGFFSFYDKLWETIDLRNTNQHYQDGLFIWDIKTFNESAIREVILNAISHRDYRMAGSVFVRQFPERIEIASPGGLPSGITFENILWEQAPRNRRLAEAFSRCGLVERSGQGMNRIYEACIRESKAEPNFTHSDQDHFWISLHGTIRHPEFLRILEKIGNEKLLSFSTDDFIVIQTVFENRSVTDRLKEPAERLCEEGLLEKGSRTKEKKWILARRIYSAVGKSGTYTRKKGLDKETNKELLLKHIKSSDPKGAKMEELLQVLPALDRHRIRSLLLNLTNEGKIFLKGSTNAARWHTETEKEHKH